MADKENLTEDILYHGSNMIIKKPKVIINPDENLGKELYYGFYVTDDKDQALFYAVNTWLQKKEGKPIVNSYKYNRKKSGEIAGIFYNSVNPETVRFIRNNLLKRKLETCSFKDVDCQKCTYSECPRNEAFIHGPLVDKKLDLVLADLITGRIDEDVVIEQITEILNETIPYTGYQYSLKEVAINAIDFIGIDPISNDTERIKYWIERIRNGYSG